MKPLLLAILLVGSLRAQNVNFYLDPSNGALPVSQLTPLPSNYSFADTAVGSSSSTVVRLVNSAKTQVTVSVIYIGKDSGSTVAATGFTATGFGLGSVIAPGNFKLFTLNFTPTAQGAATGYLQANIAGFSVSIGTLEGSGTAPNMTLSCNSSVATQCSGAILQPTATTPISFGNVLTTATVAIPFTLTNSGSARWICRPWCRLPLRRTTRTLHLR